MRTTPREGQFPHAITLRLTNKQRQGLDDAVPYSPGCASPSGVARKAIELYLEQVLGKAAA